MAMLSESRRRANKKYDEKTYSRISLLVKKELKEQTKAAAGEANETVNHYVSKAIERQIANDSNRELFNWIYSDDYDAFRSNCAHLLKNTGRIRFIVKAIDQDLPIQMMERNRLYGLYAVSLLDYACRLENMEYPTRYSDLRKQKLPDIVWPGSISLMAAIMKSDAPKQQALSNAIPEFLSHNIVEGNIEDVQ